MVKVKRSRREYKKPPLWRRRPELVLLVILGTGLLAVLLISLGSELIGAVGEWVRAGQETGPMYIYDPDEEACMDLHERNAFGEMEDFTCEMPCSTCHAQGAH